MTHEQKIEIVAAMCLCGGKVIDEGSWDDLSDGARLAIVEIDTPIFVVQARADNATWKVSAGVLAAIGEDYLTGEVS